MPTIECTIHRTGGTVVTLGDTDYHFAPDDTGRHVATVNDNAHADRLLSITPTYRLIEGKATAQQTIQPVTPAPLLEPALPVLTPEQPPLMPVAASTETAQVLQGDSGVEAAAVPAPVVTVAKSRKPKAKAKG